MSTHVASTVSGGSFTMPHAVVSPAALQMSQNASVGASGADQASSTLSPLGPIAAIGAVGLLAVTVYGIDTLCRSSKAAEKQSAAGRALCYKDAAETVVDGKLAYTKSEMKAILLELCTKKFESEGSQKRNGAKRFFSKKATLRAAARDSVRKSFKHGLSANKMVRLLNYQRAKLEHSGVKLNPVAQQAHDRDFLREFEVHRTMHEDVATMDAAKLFACADVKRFVLLYYHSLAGARGRKADASAHYIAVKHTEGAWKMFDKRNNTINGKQLYAGAPTRTDAALAVAKFARMQYTTTADVNLTVISQKPSVIPVAPTR